MIRMGGLRAVLGSFVLNITSVVGVAETGLVCAFPPHLNNNERE